jgi:PPOX class probable F420-dependent enzyme
MTTSQGRPREDRTRLDVVQLGGTPGTGPDAVELHSFLDRQRNAILATTRADGSPQVSPTWYHWDRSTVRISAPGWTKKVANIRRDPRVSVCIDDQVSGSYAAVFGRAELIEGDAVAELTWPILLKYLHPDEADVRWRRINADADRVLIRVEPRRIVWRHSVH